MAKSKFKVGDKVAGIDGKAAEALADADLGTLRYTAAGKALAFKMEDGVVRNVVAADFF